MADTSKVVQLATQLGVTPKLKTAWVDLHEALWELFEEADVPTAILVFELELLKADVLQKTLDELYLQSDDLQDE